MQRICGKEISGAVIVLKTVITSLAAMWCFFGFSVWSLGVLFFLPYQIRKEYRKYRRKQKEELELAFKDSLLYFKNALNAGYAPEGGMRETLQGLEQLYSSKHPICLAFRQMLGRMDTGQSMEDAWLKFGEQSASEEIRQFAEILAVVKRTGGNLNAVLRQTGDLLQGKIELKRDLATALAAKEAEFHIMCVLPHAILVYLRLFAPGLCEGLYHNSFGILFMWCLYIVCLFLGWLGEKIIQKEISGEGL